VARTGRYAPTPPAATAESTPLCDRAARRSGVTAGFDGAPALCGPRAATQGSERFAPATGRTAAEEC